MTTQLYPKAYFNWLRLKKEADPSFSVEPWQIEDYRELSIEALFQRLSTWGLQLSEENFLMVAENYQSPEELTHFLWPQQENEFPIYLLIFELWRRLLPEKQSLSIFCDELDHRIKEGDESSLQNMLIRLEEILDENENENPKAIFFTLTRHMSHDLEGFLYDYISDQIDKNNDLYASELLGSFYPYMSDLMWFNFLRARLLIKVDLHEGDLAFKTILEKTKDLDLILEIASFLVNHGDPHLFQKAALLALDHLETDEDFEELVATVADYCHFMDKDQEEKLVKKADKNRIRELLNDPEWVKI